VTTIIHLKWYTAVIVTAEHFAKFRLYKVIGATDGDDDGWSHEGRRFSDFEGGYYTLDAIDSAASSVAGSIIWDGCINMNSECVHFCDPAGIARFAEDLTAMAAQAIALIPNVDECAAGEYAEAVRQQ
tara:strand:- start:41 stop:424 length:384 start_codon:yes stop_codon:yes gene_type:complete